MNTQPFTSAKSIADRDITTAKQVLSCEIKGLEALAEVLDDSFVKAVTLLSQLKGRVIITGMGKSGHIARKIAATFASTGTPAFFVHPGEASHGDLGMITRDDAVIALSNSGETPELHDIIHYCRRFSIPLIAIVRREKSILEESADIAFILPATPEACNVNAPTTSTTMMLVLGDALAVALLERRAFTKEDFHIFHPGGKLGKSFTKVQELMHTGAELPVVSLKDKMSDVLITITSKRFGCAAVLGENGELAGIITDGDLRRHMHPSLLDNTAEAVMTANPVTVTPEALAVESVAIMQEKSITSLLVAKENKVEGIIHIHDCLRAGIL